MYVSARTDYAVRAMLSVAADGPHLVKAATLAAAQDIPLSFLQGILLDLRRAGLLHSHRGVDGGYQLARPADEITIGDVVRAVGGALTTVRGLPTAFATYHGAAIGLRDVWVAVEEAIEGVVDHRTLAELKSGNASLQAGNASLQAGSTSLQSGSTSLQSGRTEDSTSSMT